MKMSKLRLQQGSSLSESTQCIQRSLGQRQRRISSQPEHTTEALLVVGASNPTTLTLNSLAMSLAMRKEQQVTKRATRPPRKDDLADRMKEYEARETGRRLMPRLPICVRIDGRAFSRWTRSLTRPYDEGLSRVMIETTRFLIEEANAVVGYTQSDEISLIIMGEDAQSQPLFNGKIQKLSSVLASAATAQFMSLLPKYLPQQAGKIAMFDCRVWNVPDLQEAANVLLWREFDATRNSIQSAASALYSHRELDRKNTSQMQEMIFQKGINWNDYPPYFKRGTYLRRARVERELTQEERERIPPAHRPPEGTSVERTTITALKLPPLRKVNNRAQVLFEGAEAVIATTPTHTTE